MTKTSRNEPFGISDRSHLSSFGVDFGEEGVFSKDYVDESEFLLETFIELEDEDFVSSMYFMKLTLPTDSDLGGNKTQEESVNRDVTEMGRFDVFTVSSTYQGSILPSASSYQNIAGSLTKMASNTKQTNRNIGFLDMFKISSVTNLLAKVKNFFLGREQTCITGFH